MDRDGRGQIDQRAFFTRFRELCPDVPVHIETISGFNRELPYLQAGLLESMAGMPADRLPGSRRWPAGHAAASWQAPAGPDKIRAEQDYQQGELERSLKYCKDVLGLGLRS